MVKLIVCIRSGCCYRVQFNVVVANERNIIIDMKFTILINSKYLCVFKNYIVFEVCFSITNIGITLNRNNIICYVIAVESEGSSLCRITNYTRASHRVCIAIATEIYRLPWGNYNGIFNTGSPSCLKVPTCSIGVIGTISVNKTIIQ